MKKFIPVLLIACVVFTACSKKDSSVDETTVAAPLSAGFTVDNQNDVKEGTGIQFRNASVSGSTYKWDFGNGMKSTEKEPIFTYPACGTYNVQLFVTDAKGNTTSVSRELVVNCIFRTPGQPPVNHPPLF